MARFLTVVGFLFLLFVGLAAGARAAGRLGSQPPTYLEAGECSQPCWHGLRPGTVTKTTFLQQVQFTPYLGYATDYGNDIAMMFELTPIRSLRLADVISVFGPPIRVGCFSYDMTLHARSRPLTLYISLYFARGLIEVIATRPDSHPRLSPDMLIRSIRYYAPGEPVYPIGRTTKWRGFAAAPLVPICYIP